MSQTPPLPDPIIDEAINWLIRLDMSDSAATQHSEFEQWLQQTPEHQLAWDRVCGIHKRFSALPSKPITHALDTLEQQTRQSRLSRRQALKVLSLTGVFLGSGFAAQRYTPWQRLLADYSTVTGEQRRVELADGSQLWLNTDSAVSTDLAGSQRKLKLRRGEMQLVIAPDDQHVQPRQVRVETAGGRIQTLAGQFTVRLKAKKTRVSVQQGQVELLSRSGLTQRLKQGESYWLSDQVIEPAPSVIAPDAWVSGAISGDNIPLGELLDELSRYRLGVIDYSPELETMNVSGIFHLKNTEKTLNFLAQVQPIRVEYRSPLWVVVRPV